MIYNWYEKQSTRYVDDWGCVEAQSPGTVSRRSCWKYSQIRDVTRAQSLGCGQEVRHRAYTVPTRGGRKGRLGRGVETIEVP